MLDTKLLQYFVVAADCSSFSEAAVALYSSQSNVSKRVAALEQELGYKLFDRKQGGGISLSARGRIFYSLVTPIVESLELLESKSMETDTDIVRISTNPSSWFARRFSRFYELHRDEEYSYNIHTDTTARIIQRLRKMEDDVGFVYIFPEEYERYRYEIKRYQLDFKILGRIPEMLYYKTEEAIFSTEPIEGKKPSDTRLIQAEMDLSRLRQKKVYTLYGESFPIPRVAVTTNSDYIMNIMMRQNGLANISPGSFVDYPEGKRPGIEINTGSERIYYGALTKMDMDIPDIVNALIEFLNKNEPSSSLNKS